MKNEWFTPTILFMNNNHNKRTWLLKWTRFLTSWWQTAFKFFPLYYRISLVKCSKGSVKLSIHWKKAFFNRRSATNDNKIPFPHGLMVKIYRLKNFHAGIIACEKIEKIRHESSLCLGFFLFMKLYNYSGVTLFFFVLKKRIHIKTRQNYKRIPANCFPSRKIRGKIK